MNYSFSTSSASIARFMLVLTVLTLTACSVIQPNHVPNPSKRVQSAIQVADNSLTILASSLAPAEVEYSSKTMKPDVEKQYISAVNTYNQAHELLRLWHESVSLGVSGRYARKRFDVGLKSAQIAVGNLSRARGVK